MSKIHPFLLALLALVVGAVAGGWGVSQFWGRFAGDLSANSMAAEASTTVRTLERLRAGNITGAVEVSELKLDGAVIGLGAYIPATPASRRDPQHFKILEVARAYRSRFPRTNDSPEVAAQILRAFALPAAELK